MEYSLKAYASYFVSYLLNDLSEFPTIRNIILFGSIARGDSNEDSDVDIFIDIKKEDKNLNNKIEKIIEKFYRSREALLFKNKHIYNKINALVGKLNEWKELKNSIESTGIVLYGPYISAGIKGRKYIIISWNKVGKNRGAFLNKIYGFKAGNNRYKGLVEILNGKKVGKSTIAVPAENASEIIKILGKYKV